MGSSSGSFVRSYGSGISKGLTAAKVLASFVIPSEPT